MGHDRGLVPGNQYVIAVDPQLDRFQTLADAGSAQAVSIVYPKQGAMQRALNEIAVKVQKLIRLPFQRRTGMRTPIAIAPHSVAFTNQKDAVPFTHLGKAARTRVGQIL